MSLEIKDMNGWLKPPEGYVLTDLTAEGSFLEIEYSSEDDRIWIYLNQDGREVLRLTNTNPATRPLPFDAPQPTWWDRFKKFFQEN